MERYNEYKDSGVQWLGEIPSHWEVVRNKFIFRESEERNSERRYQLLSFSKNRGIVPHAEINDKESSAEDLSKYKILHIGQLLENRLQAWNGMFSHSEIEGCVSPDYSVFSLIKDGVNIKYVSYLFRTPLYIEQWANASKGIGSGFNRLYTPQFNAIQCLIPPFEEQNRMVAYLDTITSKIDAAIAQQQKMIDLLNERKQIIINNAVTKGLNPNVKMKDSGVDWIGEIPEHWNAVRIKYLLNEKKERSLTGNEEPLSMSQKHGLIPTKDMDIVPNMASSFVGAKVVNKGNLVFNKLKAHLGVFATSEYEGLVSPDYAVYEDTGLANLKFLEHIFKTPKCIAEFVKLITGVGAGLSRLYTGDLYSIYVSLPPYQEQKDIVDYIEASTRNIKTAISNAEKQISLLQERKQIIINEVVTGKVKVC